MERIKVAVSPFFGGEDWTCDKTGIKFEKNERGLSVYSIPADLDLTNIRKAIRLNALMLVEGNVGEHNEVKEVVVEAPVEEQAPAPVVEEAKEEAPVEEVAEEKAPVEEAPVEEAPVEEAEMSIQEAPKKATRKRAAAKK